jgi:hypothetical protein
MIEKMLDAGCTDPPKKIAAWLLVFQQCSKRLGEELLKLPGRRGSTAAFLMIVAAPGWMSRSCLRFIV